MLMDPRLVDLIARIAQDVRSTEDEIVREMVAAATGLVPILGADVVIAGELEASCRANMRRFLAAASQVADPHPGKVPAEALDIARTLVRRGVDLDAIFQGYRAGQQVGWQRWLEAASRVVGPGPDLARVLEASLAVLFRYVDDALRDVLAEAQREREAVLGGALARRVETVRLILDHAPLEESTASARLGYDLSRLHTAIVLWDEVPVAQGVLESCAGVLATAVGARRPLALVAGASALWLWLGTERPPEMLVVRRALEESRSNLRAAVGPTEGGIEGFRRSHEAAVEAHRIISGNSEGDRFATYAELEVTSLVAADERRAAAFVGSILGPLARDEPNAARLRTSLRVFLEEADNAPQAAARLHVHRNTVLQRVARATELLGFRPADRRLAVSFALELAHRLGSAVLAPPR